MASYRKLPSGKHQYTVYLPVNAEGKRPRITYTSKLKGEAKSWADAQEHKIRTGEWMDAKVSRITFEEWQAKWRAARVVEPETRRSDRAALARNEAAFKGQPLRAISRIDVQGWVRMMEQDDVGAHAIRRSYNLLTTMMGAAVLEGIIPVSPCRKIDLPATPPKSPAWFTPDEVRAIMEHLPPTHAAATALMCWSGLRWGEMAGLRVGDVDVGLGRVSIVGARTQIGEWKAYPKTARSRRTVPVPKWIVEQLDAIAGGRPAGDTLFLTTRGSRPWSGSNWRTHRWYPAVEAAGVRRYSPHACRHTAASWLVQAGVDLYRVQALLGHESFATTQRYAHLAPNAHSEVEAAWVQVQAIETGEETA